MEHAEPQVETSPIPAPAPAPAAAGFRARVVFAGSGVTVGVAGAGVSLCTAEGCSAPGSGWDIAPEAAVGVELGSEWVRLHLEADFRLWLYSDGALDLPTASVGVDVGPPIFHGTVYVHGLNVILPYVLGLRVAYSPPPPVGRLAPFVGLRVEQPLGSTLLPTGHAEFGFQWWLDRPPRPPKDALPEPDLSGLPPEPTSGE